MNYSGNFFDVVDLLFDVQKLGFKSNKFAAILEHSTIIFKPLLLRGLISNVLNNFD